MKRYKLLMLTTLIISGCSIVYELIISAVSSYLVGDSTLQYSITIGLYMCAMGLGSYVSKFVKKDLFDKFVMVEIGVGIFGGTSSIILFFSNLYLQSYQLIMYILIIVIGCFVGIEIPLLTRIIESDEENLRVTLSSIFSFDYIGGLIGSIAFPLLLLPHLGYFATASLMGACNLFAALLILLRYQKRVKHIKRLKTVTLILLMIMVIGVIFSENVSDFVESGLYRDRVILSEQTKYQKIVVTRHKDDIRLYIDGNVQFCSRDEYRYHEALVHVPMMKAKNHDHILILGGGDGMAARELLKYEDVKDITLVDLDKEMVRLCSKNPIITELNRHSLTNKKLKIHINDAYKFLEESEQQYDCIIVDLPDPNNESLNKLYSNVFYRLCGNHLAKGGVMTVQSTSPYYATKAFWSIKKTIASEDFYVYPYHLQVPAFGDWGFNLASKEELDETYKITVNTKYLDSEIIPALFSFGKDEKTEDCEINRLSKPVLMEYYAEAERNWE